MKTLPGARQSWRGGLLIALALLVCLLGGLFSRSFGSDALVFSSDGPLGNNAAAYYAFPAAFSGIWLDLNWVGGPAGSAFPSLTYLMLWVLGPLGFAKFYAPLCLLLLGLATWFCFRQLGFRPAVCTVGALAATLNTSFLSYACWGLGTVALCVAWMFVAVGAFSIPVTRRWWVKAAVAGFAVGMSVVEGFDTGAILSVYFAAFACFDCWQDGGPLPTRLGRSASRLAVVMAAAIFIAAQALTVLIGTQVQGVAGMAQDERTKEQRWTEATQWSLPKIESLRVIIPGLFGYRMDTAEGGAYWGRVGEFPGKLGTRHSGSGVYAGVFVVLVALWAFLRSLSPGGRAFEERERRRIWFWGGAAAVSLLLAWGRHAPFYRIVYDYVPYFSTIRNPVKFMHPFHVAVVILFGYGMNGLATTYLTDTRARLGSLRTRMKAWWNSASVYEKRWFTGCAAAIVASAAGWLMFLASRQEVAGYLQKFLPPQAADQTVGFSLTEVGWFILLLALGVGCLTLIASGAFSGKSSRWALVVAGALVTMDGIRANLPWIVYESFSAQYTPNILTDFLRARPYEQRMAAFPIQANQLLLAFVQQNGGDPQQTQKIVNQLVQLVNLLQNVYGADWAQHAFRYFNIQSLDLVQEPRPAVENLAYRNALGYYNAQPTGFARIWQLTNTRYLLGLGGQFADFFNQQLDPGRMRLRVLMEFTFGQEIPGGPLTVKTNSTGPFALYEFTGALPRAKVYANWQVSTNDEATLNTLASPTFDPTQTVLVSDPVPAPATTNTVSTAGRSPGSVEFLSYAPKHVRLKASTDGKAVLLLNDKFDPHWRAFVDGRSVAVLRCNYLMRGVSLEAGDHTVEFRYGVSVLPLAVSLTAIVAGLALVGLVVVDLRRGQPLAPSAAPKPTSPQPPASRK